MDDAALKVVRKVFKETSAIRFEGNGYSDAWVKGSEEAWPAQPASRAGRSGAAADEGGEGSVQVDEDPHRGRAREPLPVRVERYLKDVLIEMETLAEMLDTQILPAGYAYLNSLAEVRRSRSRPAFVWCRRRQRLRRRARWWWRCRRRRRHCMRRSSGRMRCMRMGRSVRRSLPARARDAMLACRELSDKLEVSIGDEYWPLPRYREMLFPV